MKHNTWVKNIIYLLLIVILFWVGTTLLSKIQEAAQRTYNLNINLVTLVTILFFGGIGLVLGFDNFITQLKIKGAWRFDMAKFVIVGIPAFIFSIPYMIYKLVPSMLESIHNISLVSSVVLGYTLISCVYKEHFGNEAVK
ncbi:MAG: hypothetical protein E6344_15120 [Clostridium sp.]|nr:hypothetical protein [Clostridium sp.]MDU7085025.1 hypothetical protein [Clostridium sp.]